MANNRAAGRAFIEQVFRSASHENLLLQRNAAVGAAAISLATLVSLTQVGAKSLPIAISVYASAIALPLWVLIGGVVENYITLGSTSYAHFETTLKRFESFVVLNVALIATSMSIGGVIYFLIPKAFWLFVATSIVATILGFRFNTRLAVWLESTRTRLPPRRVRMRRRQLPGSKGTRAS